VVKVCRTTNPILPRETRLDVQPEQPVDAVPLSGHAVVEGFFDRACVGLQVGISIVLQALQRLESYAGA
jgi:hypothetical protein